MNAMIKFETNKTYFYRSLCDYECIWKFTVAGRTEKTIKTTEGKQFRINAQLSAMNGAETVYPKGHYSMAPIATADKVAA